MQTTKIPNHVISLYRKTLNDKSWIRSVAFELARGEISEYVTKLYFLIELAKVGKKFSDMAAALNDFIIIT